jgi:hypothetical protein
MLVWLLIGHDGGIPQVDVYASEAQLRAAWDECFPADSMERYGVDAESGWEAGYAELHKQELRWDAGKLDGVLVVKRDARMLRNVVGVAADWELASGVSRSEKERLFELLEVDE